MKKLIMSVLAFTVIVSAPAHAISAKHRAALEWSGCDMYTESHGCDITKPKSWNDKHAPQAPVPKAPVPVKQAQVSKYTIAELMGIKGMTMPAAERYLDAHGWTKISGSQYAWKKGDNNMDYTLKNGAVANISVR